MAEASAALRLCPGNAADYSLRIALREFGRRAEFLGAQTGRLDDLIARSRRGEERLSRCAIPAPASRSGRLV
jgi:hypothetical protein